MLAENAQRETDLAELKHKVATYHHRSNILESQLAELQRQLEKSQFKQVCAEEHQRIGFSEKAPLSDAFELACPVCSLKDQLRIATNAIDHLKCRKLYEADQKQIESLTLELEEKKRMSDVATAANEELIERINYELREKEQQVIEAKFEAQFTAKLKDLGFDERFLEEYRDLKMKARAFSSRNGELEEALKVTVKELSPAGRPSLGLFEMLKKLLTPQPAPLATNTEEK